MNMLDLFAGRGGASQAMRDRGWDVTTVDVDQRFNCGVTADIKTYSYRGAPLDLIWASPPCEEFARESMPWCRTGKAPSLDLVRSALRVISEARPRFWVLENVRGAQRFLGKAKWIRNPVFLWGVFPDFDCKLSPWTERLSSAQHAERAAMPYALSEALAKAIENAIPLHFATTDARLPLVSQ